MLIFNSVDISSYSYRLVLDLVSCHKNHQMMLYNMISTRISDSKDLRCAKIETYPMKTDENDEKSIFFDIHRIDQKSFQDE